jgi:hypothetical protein
LDASSNGKSAATARDQSRPDQVAPWVMVTPWDGLDAAAVGPPFVEDPAECGDLHIEVGVLDRRRRPDGSHQLVPQYKVSGPVEKHVENI